MVELCKWYIAKNGWAFLFLVSISGVKYGIAMNNTTASGFIYTKEKKNFTYLPLKEDEIHNYNLMNLFENLSQIQRMFIKNFFKEEDFISDLIRLS